MLEINETFLAVLFNFILLVFILNYYFYKPVMNILDQRKSTVERTLSEADARMSAAQAHVEEGLQVISKANATAKQIVNDATVASGKIREESLSKVKAEIEEQRQRLKMELKQYRLEAKQSMSNDVARLSVLVAEKIIRKKMNVSVQKSIVDDLVRDMKD